MEPVLVGVGVVVEEGDDLAAVALAMPDVAGGAQAAVLGLEQVDPWSRAISAESSVEPSSTTITS